MTFVKVSANDLGTIRRRARKIQDQTNGYDQLPRRDKVKKASDGERYREADDLAVRHHETGRSHATTGVNHCTMNIHPSRRWILVLAVLALLPARVRPALRSSRSSLSRRTAPIKKRKSRNGSALSSHHLRTTARTCTAAEEKIGRATSGGN